uniref:Cytochrome c oxidase subunit 7A1, mitochondrial n=1 Tax=Cyprinus carpio carpio TaxID=630221 RepID=A0A8C1FH97_CYPCA
MCLSESTQHNTSVPRLASKAFSTTVRQMKNKVPDRQKVFLEDNGLPVHIKGGSTDVLLYRLTMTITLAGTGFSCYWLLFACMPKSKA